jgi:small subunit ribosomal protein S17
MPAQDDRDEMAEQADKDTPPAAEEPRGEPAAQAPAEGAPEAPAPAAGDADAPAQDVSAPAQAPAAEAPAEPEAQAQEAPAEAPAAASGAERAGAGAGQAAAPAAPAEELSPKQRRRLTRSRHAGEARPPRSPEERHTERVAERRVKATRRRARRLSERAKAAGRAKAGADATTAGVAGQLTPVHAAAEGKRKVRQGVVVSDKAEKTIVVRIDVVRRHRRYEKIVRSSGTLHAHDENNDAHEGDVVRVIESRPLSRTKRWRLVEVLERAR